MYASLAPASLTTTQLWLFMYLSLISFCEHGPVWVIHHVPDYFFWPPTSKHVCGQLYSPISNSEHCHHQNKH